MMEKLHVVVPAIVFLLAGVFVSAQSSQEARQIEAVRTLLRSFETKDQTALDAISSKQFIQHNAGVADGREGFTAFPAE
jgi:predicted SnoaL-like aldol condensation-catalyzing enzyme